MSKITNTELKKAIGEDINSENIQIKLPLTNKEVTVTVKKMIPLEEMAGLINTVIEQSFSNDEYKPYLHRFSYVRNMLAYFTNLPYNCDNEVFTYLVYKSKIFSLIEEKISPKQMYDIRNMIEKGINFHKEMSISHQKKLLNIAIDAINAEQEDIISQITNLLSKFDNMDFDVDKLDKILDKVNEFSTDKTLKGINQYAE